jgi:Ca2+-binding EF-hand superfamily protein
MTIPPFSLRVSVSKVCQFGVLLGLASVCLPSLAGEKPDAGDAWLLAKYDANADRYISPEEVAQRRDKIVVNMDVDQNQRVSFAEYQEYDLRKRQALLKARFAKMDLDANGELSVEEHRSYLGSFAQFDLDRDGKISAEEMKSADTQNPVAQQVKETKSHCLLWFCVKNSL